MNPPNALDLGDRHGFEFTSFIRGRCIFLTESDFEKFYQAQPCPSQTHFPLNPIVALCQVVAAHVKLGMKKLINFS